jgi:hypothetical protein
VVAFAGFHTNNSAGAAMRHVERAACFAATASRSCDQYLAPDAVRRQCSPQLCVALFLMSDA